MFRSLQHRLKGFKTLRIFKQKTQSQSFFENWTMKIDLPNGGQRFWSGASAPQTKCTASHLQTVIFIRPELMQAPDRIVAETPAWPIPMNIPMLADSVGERELPL